MLQSVESYNNNHNKIFSRHSCFIKNKTFNIFDIIIIYFNFFVIKEFILKYYFSFLFQVSSSNHYFINAVDFVSSRIIYLYSL